MTIQAVGLSKSFRTGRAVVHALREASLAVEDGRFVCIHGPSGSGKTTLLNILGLIDRPSTGIVKFEDIDVSSMGEGRRTRLRKTRVGLVFQDYSLIPNLTIRENVMYPLLFSALSVRERRVRVEKLLETTGVASLWNRMPEQISGGEKQRVAVARALANEPRLVIADEPTANLDTKNAETLIRLLRDITSTHGVTCVVASHDLRVKSNADMVFELVDGRLSS